MKKKCHSIRVVVMFVLFVFVFVFVLMSSLLLSIPDEGQTGRCATYSCSARLREDPKDFFRMMAKHHTPKGPISPDTTCYVL